MQVMQAIGQFSLLLVLLVLASSFHVGQSNCQNSSLTRSIPSHVNVSVAQLCNAVPGMTQKQSEFCTEIPDLMTSIMHGAHLAMQECQYQFQYRRWNCSIPERDNNNTLFHLLKGRGTREAAFTYAIASAAVAHSIARACVQGNVSTCGCGPDEERPKNWKSGFRWGGCGDNIEAGVKFARKFMMCGEDSRMEGQALTLMNLHNIETGIQVVKENSLVRCMCVSIDSDCRRIKTCWRQLAEFRDIARILFSNYEHAVRVRSVKGKALKILVPYERNGHPPRRPDKRYGHPSQRPASGIMGHPSRRPATPANSSLIYLKRSPNYCVENEKRGSIGTVGRVCNRDSDGYDSCELLCCGRGFRKVRVAVKEKCNCKFHWCCYVKCEECTSYEMRDICR